MDGMISQEEQKLHAQAGQVRGKLQELAADLRVLDDEVESFAPQRTQHELLEKACTSLEKLGELGAAALFWGESMEPARVTDQLRGVRSRVTAFQAQLSELDGRRQAVLAKIGREEENLDILAEDLYDIREAEERRKLEWVIERDVSLLPHHAQVMAWSRGGEDDWRFRKALTAMLVGSLLLAALLPMIDLPLPKRFQPDAVPKRIVQLIRQEQAKLVTPPPVATKPPEPETMPKPGPEPKPSDIREQPSVPRESERGPAEPTRQAAGEPGLPPGQPGPIGPEPPGYAGPETPVKRAGKAGILAFRDQFASLAKDRVAPRLGAEARFNDADNVSQASTRSMLTTNAPGSSGGINLASLSRHVGGGGGGGGGTGGTGGGGGDGGGGGGGMGVQVGRATSSITSIGGDDRPKARSGIGSSRTDEEIQIVFDRYKASFYRLYNRELRNDPTLRGQMVLRLTIEPDGSVSMCVLQSTDMNAPDLATQVVNRVRTINFGAKEGVQPVTIAYPIDFLPAA